jgi:hypothetical protein
MVWNGGLSFPDAEANGTDAGEKKDSFFYSFKCLDDKTIACVNSRCKHTMKKQASKRLYELFFG